MVCSVCKGDGHNKRNCPVAKSIVTKEKDVPVSPQLPAASVITTVVSPTPAEDVKSSENGSLQVESIVKSEHNPSVPTEADLPKEAENASVASDLLRNEEVISQKDGMLETGCGAEASDNKDEVLLSAIAHVETTPVVPPVSEIPETSLQPNGLQNSTEGPRPGTFESSSIHEIAQDEAKTLDSKPEDSVDEHAVVLGQESAPASIANVDVIAYAVQPEAEAPLAGLGDTEVQENFGAVNATDEPFNAAAESADVGQEPIAADPSYPVVDAVAMEETDKTPSERSCVVETIPVAAAEIVEAGVAAPMEAADNSGEGDKEVALDGKAAEAPVTQCLIEQPGQDEFMEKGSSSLTPVVEGQESQPADSAAVDEVSEAEEVEVSQDFKPRPGFRIVGLGGDVSEQELREFLEPFCAVTDVALDAERKDSAVVRIEGGADVEVDTVAKVREAVQGAPLKGHNVRMETLRADALLFIGNLKLDIDDAELQRMFEPHGTILRSFVMRNAEGRSKGYAFLEYANKAQAQAAKVALGNLDMDGRVLRVEWFEYARVEDLFSTVLFVDRIPKERMEIGQQLQKLFEESGKVRELQLVMGVSGFPRGFAFVDFFHSKHADKAHRALDGYELEGSSLRVSFANPNKAGQVSKFKVQLGAGGSFADGRRGAYGSPSRSQYHGFHGGRASSSYSGRQPAGAAAYGGGYSGLTSRMGQAAMQPGSSSFQQGRAYSSLNAQAGRIPNPAETANFDGSSSRHALTGSAYGQPQLGRLQVPAFPFQAAASSLNLYNAQQSALIPQQQQYNTAYSFLQQHQQQQQLAAALYSQTQDPYGTYYQQQQQAVAGGQETAMVASGKVADEHNYDAQWRAYYAAQQANSQQVASGYEQQGYSQDVMGSGSSYSQQVGDGGQKRSLEMLYGAEQAYGGQAAYNYGEQPGTAYANNEYAKHPRY